MTARIRQLSVRAFHRVLKLAGAIADLAEMRLNTHASARLDGWRNYRYDSPVDWSQSATGGWLATSAQRAREENVSCLAISTSNPTRLISCSRVS